MSGIYVFAPIFASRSGGPDFGWQVIYRTPDDDAWEVYLPGPMSEQVARNTAAALNDHAVRTSETGGAP